MERPSETTSEPPGTGRVVPESVSRTESQDAQGWGRSYWGDIPPPADSIAAVFREHPRPAWEYPLLVPYRLLTFPFAAFHVGTKATFAFLDDQGVIRWIGEILGPREIAYGLMVSARAGGLSGIGGGLTFFHDEFLGQGHRLKIRTLYTSTEEQRYSLGMILDEGAPAEWELGAGYRLRRNARFFGLGPDAGAASKSYFSQETSWGGASVRQHLAPDIRLAATAIYSGAGARLPSGDETPSLPEEFEDRPYGYGDLSEGATFTLSLERDQTRTTGRPETGNVQRLRASYFTGGGDVEAHFWSYRIDLEQYVPLWHTERVLALRGYVNWFDAARDEVPFQRLLTNDEPDILRGFKDYRWRDRGLTAFTAEYRWPVWANRDVGGTGVDAYLFTDLGQVFGTFEQISRRNVTTSYGGGFRLIGHSGFTGLIEIGVSKEEVVFRLSADQVFQYVKRGLYNGRDQVALR